MTYQQLQTLNYYATTYGKLFFDIAYEALCNGAGKINCEKPQNRSAIALPEGITRFSQKGEVEYCCRAKLLPGFIGPYRGANAAITDEFNSVAMAHMIPEHFEVHCEPYSKDPSYIMIVAKPD